MAGMQVPTVLQIYDLNSNFREIPDKILKNIFASHPFILWAQLVWHEPRQLHWQLSWRHSKIIESFIEVLLYCLIKS